MYYVEEICSSLRFVLCVAADGTFVFPCFIAHWESQGKQGNSGKLKKIERNSGKVRKRMEGQGISGKLRETHVKSWKIYFQIVFFVI